MPEERESLLSEFISGVGEAISEAVFDTAGPHGAAELGHALNTGSGYVPYGWNSVDPGQEVSAPETGFQDMLQSYSGPEVEPPAIDGPEM